MIYRHLFCSSLVLTLGFAALEFSPPASARAGIACSTPITGAPSGPATVSTASTAYGQVLVVGSAEYSGCSLYLLTFLGSLSARLPARAVPGTPGVGCRPTAASRAAAAVGALPTYSSVNAPRSTAATARSMQASIGAINASSRPSRAGQTCSAADVVGRVYFCPIGGEYWRYSKLGPGLKLPPLKYRY